MIPEIIEGLLEDMFQFKMDKIAVGETVTLDDYLKVAFQFIAKDNFKQKRVIETVFFYELKALLVPDNSWTLTLDADINSILPRENRANLLIALQRTGYKQPPLSLPPVGFFLIVFTFCVTISLLQVFLFSRLEVLLALPLIFQLSISLFLAVIPVVGLTKLLPMLFTENRLYYIRSVGDYVKEVSSLNLEYLSNERKLEIFSDFVKMKISDISSIPSGIVGGFMLRNLNLQAP